MQPKWTGPYEVVYSAGKGVYSLRNPSTGRFLKQAVHAVRLKEYFTQETTKTGDQTQLLVFLCTNDK